MDNAILKLSKKRQEMKNNLFFPKKNEKNDEPLKKMESSEK